ncbi:MAG: hypothetical protein ACYC7E_14280 [Armatimonadota bacterium]
MNWKQLVALGVGAFIAYWPMAFVSLDDDYWAPLISLHPIWRHVTDEFLFYWGFLLLVLLLVLWGLHTGRFRPTSAQRVIALCGAAMIALSATFGPDDYESSRFIFERIIYHSSTALTPVLVGVELLLIISLLLTNGGLPQRDQSYIIESFDSEQWTVITRGIYWFIALVVLLSIFSPVREDSSSGWLIIPVGILIALVTSITLIVNWVSDHRGNHPIFWMVTLVILWSLIAIPILLTYFLLWAYSPFSLLGAVVLSAALLFCWRFVPKLRKIKTWVIILSILGLFLASYFIGIWPDYY